jgi:hypothetical protein
MRAGLTGWVDYDRPTLPSLSRTERIDWFEHRVRLVAINPLRLIVETQITADPTSSALLIFGVSLCCAIEAMGKFVVGNKPHDARFDAFISGYMSPVLKTGTMGQDTYADVLRKHFRNGLTHGFAVCHGGFEGGHGNPYFVVNRVGGYESLSVNPAMLFDDFVQGVEEYIGELRAGDPKVAMFDTMFDDVFIKGK